MVGGGKDQASYLCIHLRENEEMPRREERKRKHFLEEK
jgi:hypothetical protein